MRTLLPAIIFLLLLGGCGHKEKMLPLQTVASLDLERYSGLWYEIARYENRFEQGCVAASAFYMQQENHIGVTNRCYDANGTLIGEAQGKAYSVDPTNSRLEVSFFWPFYGDYYVIMLDPMYRYSVVGEPKRRYLWILARTPNLEAKDKANILAALPAFGYDPQRLFWCMFASGVEY